MSKLNGNGKCLHCVIYRSSWDRVPLHNKAVLDRPPEPVSSQGKSLLMSAQGLEPRRVELIHLCIFSLEKRRGHDSIFKAVVDLT